MNVKYPLAMRILHWTMAVLILGMIWVGWTMVSAGEDDFDFYPWHKSFGLLIFILVIIGTPVFAVMGGWTEIAWLTHQNPEMRVLRFLAPDVLDERFAGSPVLVTIPLFTFIGYMMAESKTPMLVIHGEKDARVPISEALILWTDMQRLGVPGRFLYFPDENHWVLKPENSVQWHETVLDWLDRWTA